MTKSENPASRAASRTNSQEPMQVASPFYGVGTPGELRGKRRCQLVLISNAAVNHESDFHRISEYIREYDPKITTTVITRRAAGYLKLLSRFPYPTLTISLVPLARFRPPRGTFLHGLDLSKSEEYARLEAAGFPVPRWQIIKQHCTPDVSGYGEYVVTKPNRGLRGALVRIKRKSKVRYEPLDKSVKQHQGRNPPGVAADCEMLAQQFIYTGEWPISYRVTTLFGIVLHSEMSHADPSRERLNGPADFNKSGVSNIVSTGRGCFKSLSYDEEVIRLGEAAHAAFPEIPLLGFDIVREVSSGKLYVLEANAVGYVWHFSSSLGQKTQQDNGFNYESQFDGLRKAAHILADKTQELAI